MDIKVKIGEMELMDVKAIIESKVDKYGRAFTKRTSAYEGKKAYVIILNEDVEV